MSRTQERYRRKDAERRGYLAGKYGDAETANPYKALETRHAWRSGWDRGKKELEKNGD